MATEKRKQLGEPQTVELRRYRTDEALWASRPDMQGLPVTAHAALLDRTRRLLEVEGFNVGIHYADN